MRLIPWLEDGRIANNTRSVAAKRGTREVFSPTGSSRPGPNDLSPMNGPQPLAPCSSTGKQHQGFTGYGPRLTTATVSRGSLACQAPSSHGFEAAFGGAGAHLTPSLLVNETIASRLPLIGYRARQL